MSFSVYKSSAGSGKTFTLVREYLTLVISDPNSFRNVLGITFTNKAANEMKERVMQYLEMLSDPSNHRNKLPMQVILPDLKNRLDLQENEIAQRAQNVLGLILHNYSEFAIGTIDSFVHRVVRTFAHDLYLPLNFEVELEEDELIARAVDLMISTIGSDEKLTRILLSYTMDKVEQEKSWNIDRELRSFASSLLKEDGQLHIRKLKQLSRDDFIHVHDQLRAFNASFENELQSIAAQCMTIIQKKRIRPEAFHYGKNGIYSYFDRIAHGDFSKLEPNSHAAKTIANGKWTSGKTTVAEKEIIDAIQADLSQAYHKILEKIERENPKYQLFKILYNNVYPLAVLNEISFWMDEVRQSNNILHISEFNRRIAEIVLNEPVPFIYERLGEKYKYFLIDEFQDTSVLQWQNILPLLENSLAMDNFNLVVGDGKQAIYRFRNGDVKQFAVLPEIPGAAENPLVRERESMLKRNYKEYVLDHNFRSARDIIEFNNDFFESAAKSLAESYQRIYEKHVQAAGQYEKRGYVKICLFDKKNAKENFEEFNLNQLLSAVKDALRDDFALRDIAVICRSNHEAGIAAAFLLEKEFPVVSSESLLLGNSPHLNFLVSLIKYLQDPEARLNEVHIATFLQLMRSGMIENNVLFGLNDKESKGDLSDQELDMHKNLMGLLKEWGYGFSKDYLRSLSIYDLCEELIRIFGFDEKPDPFIQFFLDAVFDFSRKNNPGFDNFLEWWEEKKSRLTIVMPENMDAIRVLTIHKAKGLEFPVVVYPFANNHLKSSLNSMWVDLKPVVADKLSVAYLPVSKKLMQTDFRELYEEEMNKSLLDLLNLVYVAMTRASDRLYIFSEHAPDKKNEINSIPKLIALFLTDHKLIDNNQNEFEFGKKASKSRKTDQINVLNELQDFHSYDWRERLLLSTAAPDQWDVENFDKKREYGKMVHLVLSRIHTKNDLDSVLDEFKFRGMINDLERSDLNQYLNKLLESPELKPYFEKDSIIYAEKEIMLPDGKSYRPDRVVFKDSETIILDYKTGQQQKKHISQIKQYASILKDMGYQNVKTVLVYVGEENEVVEV